MGDLLLTGDEKIDKAIINIDKKIIASETMSLTEFVTTGASNVTRTLPKATENEGKEYTYVKTDSGAGYVTIACYGTQTINGVTSIVIEKQYCGIRVRSDGENYIIVGTIGECEIQTIGAAIELVYTTVASGTTDVSGGLSIAHGLSSKLKIISLVSSIEYNSTNYYWAYGEQSGHVINTVHNDTYITLWWTAIWNNSPYKITYKYYI